MPASMLLEVLAHDSAYYRVLPHLAFKAQISMKSLDVELVIWVFNNPDLDYELNFFIPTFFEELFVFFFRYKHFKWFKHAEACGNQ